MRVVAVMALASCAGSGEGPSGSPGDLSMEDSAAPMTTGKVLGVTIVDPATRAPLVDGDEVGLFYNPLQDHGHVALGLEISGSYQGISVDWTVVRLDDGSEIELETHTASYLLSATAQECNWSLPEFPAGLMTMDYAAYQELPGQAVEITVRVTDLTDGAEASATVQAVTGPLQLL